MRRIIALLIVLVPTIAFADPPVSIAKRPLEAWIADLDDKDALVQAEAIEMLTQLGTKAKPAVPKLEHLVTDGTESVRRGAALAIWKIDGRPDAAIPLFKTALKDAKRISRIQTVQTLFELGVSADELAPLIVELLSDSQMEARNLAATVLRGFGAKALPTIVDSLPSSRGDRLFHLVHILISLRPKSEESLPKFIDLLKDPDASVRTAAAVAVLALNRGNPSALTALQDLAQSQDAKVRTEVLRVTLILFRRSSELNPIYLAGLTNPDPNARIASVQALLDVDRSHIREVLPVLLAELKQPKTTFPRTEIDLIARIGPDASAAIPFLVDILKRPDERRTHGSAALALGRMGPDGIPPLAALLRENDPGLRMYGFLSLSQLGSKGFEIIQPYLKDENADKRRMAADAVGRFGKAAAPAISQLVVLLGDSNFQVRNSAVIALGAIGPTAKSAMSPLTEFAKSVKQNATARAAAVEALGQIGPDAVGATETLRELLKSLDGIVRFRAAESLAKIDGKSPEARAVLLEMLKPNGTTIGFNLAMVGDALSAHGAAAKDVIPLLAERLKSTENQRGFPHLELIEIMVMHYGQEQETLSLLKELIAHSIPEVRRAAAIALAERGAEAKDAVPVLLANAKLEMNLIRVFGPDNLQSGIPDEVLAALAAFGPEAAGAFDDLRELGNKPQFSVQKKNSIAETLIRIDRSRATGAQTYLERQMVSSNDGVSFPAMKALCRVDPKNSKLLPSVLILLERSNESANAQGMDMLAVLGPDAKSALPTVQTILNGSPPVMRVRAAFALSRIERNPALALSTLTTALTETDLSEPIAGSQPTQHRAARYAAWALGELGATAKDSLPALREVQNQGDIALRVEATAAIRKIEKK